MPAAPEIDVRYVAKLARLALDEDEVARYGAQLAGILSHVAALAELPTENVEATAQVIRARNVEREDELRPCLPRDLALAGAPCVQGGYFRVPRIIAEDG